VPRFSANLPADGISGFALTPLPIFPGRSSTHHLFSDSVDKSPLYVDNRSLLLITCLFPAASLLPFRHSTAPLRLHLVALTPHPPRYPGFSSPPLSLPGRIPEPPMELTQPILLFSTDVDASYHRTYPVDAVRPNHNPHIHTPSTTTNNTYYSKYCGYSTCTDNTCA